MDFHGMTRKALQALCKKHNIPANGTTLKMADALSSLLNQAHEEIKPRGPSCLKGFSRESAAQVAGEVVLVNPKKAVIRAPKKVTFLLQEEIPDEEVSHGKRKVGRISSKIRPEPEENSHGTVEEEVRITRSRARKSSVGDVAQCPIVEKRMTTKRSESETDEEKKNLRRVKARAEVGEFTEQPSKEDELTDTHAQNKNSTRRSKRNVSKLELSSPADVVTKKDGIGRIPLATMVETTENGVKSRKSGGDEMFKEVDDMLVRTTRSRAKKSLVGDVTQIPIAQKRNTRRSETATDDEKNVDSNQEEKRNQSKANANREVGEISYKNGENKRDGKNSQQPDKVVQLTDKVVQLTEIHFQQDMATRQSTRVASKLAVSVPADAEIHRNEVAGVSLKMTSEAEETGAKYTKKESDETVERTQVLLVRTLRSHARQSLLGDAAQFPIVEKRMTRKGAKSETHDENNVNAHGEKKKKPSGAKSNRKVGEILNDSETEGQLMESGKENESTERHSQPEKATRRSKRNVPKFAASVQTDVAMQNDEIVRSNEPRKRSMKKILEEVDSAAENATGFDNGTVISKENVADKGARHDNELKGQSKRLASSKHEMSLPSNERDGRQKRQRDLVAEGGAGERAKRSKCPISSNHRSRRITKAAEEQVQGNEMSACGEAPKISIIEEFVASGSGNLPTDCTDGGMPIFVDGIVMMDNNLKTAEVVELSIETTRTSEELDHGGTEVVELKDSTIEVSACKGDKEISEAVNVTVFPQVNSDIVEMAQIREADLEVPSEGAGANEVSLEGRIAGDSSESYQEKGAERFAYVKDIVDVFKSDCEETSAEAQVIAKAAAVSNASCIHDLSHIHVNDDIVRNVSEMVDEFEISRRLSLGQQIHLGNIGEASATQISPEKCVIEHHAVVDQKDPPEFTEGSDKFVKAVHGDSTVISNENGITQGNSEVSDHVCVVEENGFSNGIHISVSEGLQETVMPELGSVELEIYDTGFRSPYTAPENGDPNDGEENENAASDSTGGEDAEEENAFLNEISRADYESNQTVTDPCVSEGGEKNGDDKCTVFSEEFQENPEMVKEDVVLGCKTGTEPKDIIKEVEERNVKTTEDNGGDVDETGSAEIFDEYNSDDRFKNSVATPKLSDVLEECETIENLSSGQEIYPGDNGLASCAQSTTDDGVVKRHGAVELVSGDCEVVSNANGITQGNIEKSDHEVAQEENAFLKKISGVEVGNIHTASGRNDAQGGEEENGDDAKEIHGNISKEFQDAPEIETEGCDGGCKTGSDLKDNGEEAEKRNLNAVEDNAGDMDEQENADMKSLASPNLLNIVEELEAIEKPSSGQKIYLGDDALTSFTQITPSCVNKYDLLKKERESSEAGDRFAETVTRNLVNGEFQVIPMQNGNAQGNSEESDHKGTEEENAFLNEICGHVSDELGQIASPELASIKLGEFSHECRSTVTVSKCHTMGAEEHGDDAKDTQGVVSSEFEHEFSVTLTEVADQDCEVCVELKDHSENVKINASTVEANQEDVDEKENDEMLKHKFDDDKRSENSFSEGSQRFGVLESEGTAEMVAFGVCAFSPVSTPKPQDALARSEKMSLCKQILSLVKHEHGDDDTKIHVGGTAKKHSNKMVNVLRENDVGDEAVTCVYGDVITAEEAEDESSLPCAGAVENREKAQEISEQNENESSLHEELRETSGATENDYEHNAKAVAQSALEKLECKDHEKIVEVNVLCEYDVGDEAVMCVYGNVITAEEAEVESSLHYAGVEENHEKVQEISGQNKNESSLHKELREASGATENENEHNAEAVAQSALEKLECKDHEKLVGENVLCEYDVEDEAVMCVYGNVVTAEEAEVEPSLHCSRAEENCEKAQEISGQNENESSLHEELREDSGATENENEHNAKAVAQSALEKPECKDHEKIVEVKGLREGVSYEEGKTPEKIQKEECIVTFTETLKVEAYESIREDILYTMGQELHNEDDHEESEKRENAVHETENLHRKESEEAICQKHEHLEAQGDEKMTVAMFASGNTFLTPINEPECQGINQEEVPIPVKSGSEQYFEEGSASSLPGTMIAVEQLEDGSPVKCEGTEMRSEEPQEISGAKETESNCWKEYGKASNLEGTLGELQPTTEILAHFASEKLDCKDQAEIAEKGSDESILGEPGCISFEEVRVRANEMVLNKDDFSCDCTQVVQESECVLAMEKELELEVPNLFDQEMAYILGDELKYDDCKKSNERKDADEEMKNADCMGYEDASPVKCEGPLNVQEVEAKNADAGALSTVLASDDDAEHQGNEYEGDLAFIVDAAIIRSPVTDSTNRCTESYLSEKNEQHDGQEDIVNSWSSLSRHVLNKGVTHEVTLNMIGSGSAEARVEEVGSLFSDMWISTVQAEKQTCRNTSQTLKSAESLKHWPSSVEMKENTPVVKQGQLSNRSLGKSAMSVHKRRALQDLQIVKEQ